MKNAADRFNGFRYERKFFISADCLDRKEIEAVIRFHPAMFSEIYSERFINNIYFDSYSMDNYVTSVEGMSNRVKCRIRWYGDLFGKIEKPVLEFKIKSGLMNKKESFPLTSFSLDENFTYDDLAYVLRCSKLPEKIEVDILSLTPTLLNRYTRRYYQSSDHNYRITIDKNLEFYLIRSNSNTFFHRSVDDLSSVVELKYSPDMDEGSKKITSYFPFRVTKSSKYVTGIERLYL